MDMNQPGYDVEALFAQLVDHEGDREFVYDDATGQIITPGTVVRGNPTVGIGRNLIGRGLTPEERKYLCMNDIAVCVAELDRNVPWWRNLSPTHQEQMIDLTFNMGWPRFSGFVRFLAAMEAGNSKQAAAELQDSLWWNQVGRRGPAIVAKILAG
jgi:lysozyme